jgi:hypothetical protein
VSLAPGGGALVAGRDDTYIPTNYVAANEVTGQANLGGEDMFILNAAL